MKVGFLIVNRANWARSKTIAEALSDLGASIKVYSASSMNLEKFGTAVEELETENNYDTCRLMSNVEGATLETQALSTGLLIQLLTVKIAADQLSALIVIADRFEVIAGAIVASYLNIPLIHIQGGEVSGNIDNKVRYAVSAFADLHFPCSKNALKRLTQGNIRGEVMNYGCPAMDLATRYSQRSHESILQQTRHVGETIRHGSAYCLVTLHPDTKRFEHQRGDAKVFFAAIDEISLLNHCVIIWPNVDGGSDIISKVIRGMRESGKLNNCSFYKNINFDDYPSVVKNAALCIGNSSSFLREAAHFGTPAIIVGTRQADRDNYGNATFAKFHKQEILTMYQKYIHIRFKANRDFGEGDAGKKIAKEILKRFGKS